MVCGISSAWKTAAGKTIYIEVEKDGKTIAPRFAYAIPETQDTDPEAKDADTSAPDYAGDANSLASPKLSR